MTSSLISRRSASNLRSLPSHRPRPSSPDPKHSSPSRRMAQLGKPLKVVISLAAFALLSWSAYLAFFTSHFSHLLPGVYPEIITHADLEALIPLRNEDTNTTRRLRLFMPADSPHINLCKTIMSAVALGYPMPTLLNWNREYNRPDWHFAGSHIAKLESLLGAIEALLEDADTNDDVGEDDLAVMMDAYDIWFQLPPSVLIQRYHQLNREADERLREHWHTELQETQFPIPPPRQDIIVTTAKDCFPDRNSGSDPHYEHWPESPMPKDMYGEGTDQVPFSFDSARKFKNVRPRCVNSGMIMGTMGALRDVLRRARDKVDAVVMDGRQLWSDQALFAEIIGEQEMWRKWAKHLESSWDGGVSHNDLSSLSPEISNIARAALDGRRFDFGIGLDYNFTTMPPTCSAEEDGAFVHINDAASLRAESTKAGVRGDVRIRGIPHELNNDEDALLADVKWGDVPLYSDLFFGSTPVAIHHNAYVGGLKPWRLKHWWDKMWYYPQLRDLVIRRLGKQDGERKPLARIDSEEEGEIVYWAPREDEERKTVRVFEPSKKEGEKHNLRPIEWDSVCQRKGKAEWYDELFGDNKGPLEV
ncbi:hypothetical protein B0T10DRAFT_492366 [Thelonectria olida]|uniref:Uncharacterized protein n=1 Tax=Thelonectria olida TaxID=1576542 RepID=A0A9P8W1W2_9HYPO|nr:hypothetical protein B0T10DRAFT_492366 [Thelonectria olida]